MFFGVVLQQQWISGYTAFVPNWSELPVGVLLRQQWILGYIEFVPDYWNKSFPINVSAALTKMSLSGPESGAADAHGITDLLRALVTSNDPQAVIACMTTLSKTMVEDRQGIAEANSGANFKYIIGIMPPWLAPPRPLFKHLKTISAECPDLLEINPSDVLVESGEFEQTTIETDSGSRYIITTRPMPKYYIILQWKGLKQEDADKIISMYLTTTKAFGRARSFRWKHPIDDLVYVVRFADDINTDRRAEITNRESIKPIQLEILGASAD